MAKKEIVTSISKEKLQYALNEALKKIDRNLDVFTTVFPSHASVNNVYIPEENVDGWQEGFWSGILWIAYELTGDEKYKNVAMMQIPTYKHRLEKRLVVDHHDMGFLYVPSCVAAYKLTGDEEAKNTAIAAADNLMLRYHETGQFIQAWGPLGARENYRLIIDCLLNIPLFYWASEVTGDSKYEEAAYNHYKTTMANIIREDGSSFHTFYFDPETGEPVKGVTAQGAADDSCWARGQAWGIYGVMLTHMYKKNPDAIEYLKRFTDYFKKYLPDDYIPYWDLSFTEGDEPRDSSAAAIAACGLIEAGYNMDDNDEKKSEYMNLALTMMDSLIDSYLTKDIEESNGLLLHAVYNRNSGNGVDECNIWGDYFYMEALARLIKGKDFKAYW